MLTSAVYLVIAGLAFMLISKWRGAGRAYLAICWAPLAAFAVGYAVGGYSAIAILTIATVASLGLTGLGVVLAVRAKRAGSREATRLTAGTIVACIPVVIMIVAAFGGR